MILILRHSFDKLLEYRIFDFVIALTLTQFDPFQYPCRKQIAYDRFFRDVNQQALMSYIVLYPGWWYTYPSEKSESQLGL